jgi:methenyltetrahydrofolate cyclohydrolase
MSSLWDLNLTQLQQRVSSLDPTPGGGSISVMNAVLGLSLVQKGIRVSLKNAAGNSSSQEELSSLEIRAVSAMEPLKRYVDADTDAFQGYMQASGLPRSTEEERATRKRVMEEALLHATKIPLEAASQMNRCIEIAESAIRLAKQSVLSDIAAGALLIRASIQAVLLNVDSNLAGISDSFMRKELSERRKQLETAMLPCIETVLQEFQRRVTALG